MLLTIIVNSYVLSVKLLEYRADKLNMKFLGYQNVDKSFVHLLFDHKLLDLSDKFYRLEDREALRSGAAWLRDTTCRYGPPFPFPLLTKHEKGLVREANPPYLFAF